MPGHGIDELKFSEMVKLVKSLDDKEGDWVPLKIAFLRNITIDPIVPYIKFLCYEENLRASIYMGDYDNVMQDVIDANSTMYRYSPDVIIICLKMETLAEKLAASFCNMTLEDINEESNKVIGFVDKVLSEIRRNTEAVILLHSFETPVYPSFGILDYQDRFKQVNTFRRINSDLLDVIAKYDSTYVVDIDLLKSTIGYRSFTDNRYWHIGRSPYTREAYKIIAQEYMKFIRALKGKNRKCLVLDCDNTLWGGIVGEDGINKINIGKTYPGSAYREFQQAILNLHNRGIMLAICSKNNDTDVMEVLGNHPDMILRKEHFVSMKINWNDKVTNLKEIASELNIGSDSLVLIDDSDFEINMVRKMLPEVTAIKLPNDPSSYRDLLNSCGLFDTLTFSEEDQKRTEMYKAEIGRRKAKREFQAATLEDYYKYLEMEVSIQSVDEFTIPRISQLTQRTNQFNLTTKRYSESEIRQLSESNDSNVRYLSLKDRFGDSGIVGVTVLKYLGKESLIDTFLLSCRIIGRGVEDILLKDCVDMAVRQACDRIVGLYIPTKKNGQVEQFYANHGFSCIENNSSRAKYSFSLKESFPDFPVYFKSIQIGNG